MERELVNAKMNHAQVSCRQPPRPFFHFALLTRPTQTLSDHDSLKQRLASVQAMLNNK